MTPSGSGAKRLDRGGSTRLTSYEADLGSLLAAVLSARARQSKIRVTPGRHVDSVMTARRACLQAIEDYTAALESRCLPIPYQMQMERALLRTVCGAPVAGRQRQIAPLDAALPAD